MNIVEPIRRKKDLKKIESILRKQSLRDLLLFTIGTNCGLRISDILNLDVRDVQNKDYISITEKKTGKYKRFPINSKLKPMFAQFTQGRKADEPLFLSANGFLTARPGRPTGLCITTMSSGLDFK